MHIFLKCKSNDLPQEQSPEKALSTDPAPMDSTVRVGPLANIPKLLHSLNCDTDRLFEGTGFKPDEFKNTEHRISYLKGSQLLAKCATETNCEHFGLLLGQLAGPSYLGVAGFLARTASTVRQALEALVENLDLHDGGGSCDLHIGKDYSRLMFRIHQPGVSASAQIYDMSVVVMCEIMRALCGGTWNASQVLLTRKKPQDIAPYTRYYRTAVLFNSESCGIVFPNSYLQLKPPMADELFHRHLELEANAAHRVQSHEIVETLPDVLHRALLQGQCSATDVADTFGIQERTLHRRLKASGTTFRHELDRARESLSTQLLESSSLPICDIATSLAYADSSGFIRAFKRWTGTSPAVWRKNYRQV